MKNLGIAFAIVLMLMFSIIIVMSLNDRGVRGNEAQDAFRTVCQSSMENVMTEHTYTIADTDELVADLAAELLLKVDNDADITINILKTDLIHGIISLEIIENYRYANGKNGTLSYTCTLLLDRPAA